MHDCFDDEYIATRSAAQADAAYLQSPELAVTFRALSRYAKSSRYYFLDIVGGATPQTGSPHDEWDVLERHILNDRKDLLLMLAEPATAEPVFDELARLIVIRFERAARALCRLFVFGPLGELGRQYSGWTNTFLLLDDEVLGQRDYAALGV